jgi:hypothetical protein
MGRFGCVHWAGVIIAIFLLLLLPACGGKKPPGANPFPAKITLNPAVSLSLQLGGIATFTASAQNGTNGNISPTFTFSSSNPGILDISSAGLACAGTWNAPYFNVCTPAAEGVAMVTASALGQTSPPTMVFVHPPIDNIQISVVPPVNSPPPACPAQVALPLACKLEFNGNAANYCLSQNQSQTLQATAFSRSVDITAAVGPFTWSQANSNVVTITPIVTSSTNVVTNQATVVSNTPGQTQVIASAAGVSSQPYSAETCPVQCIALEVGSNVGQTGFIANKGTSETINATAVDVQGCIVPKPSLTWTSSAPAALTTGSGTTGTTTTGSGTTGTTTTGSGTTGSTTTGSTTTTGTPGCTGAANCTIGTAQPGAAAITASCTPPTCNIGFPLVPAGIPELYVPQPVYPVTAISGLVTGAAVSTSLLAASQDCYSNSLCTVALYNISTAKNLASNPSSMPTAPNSLIFDQAGDKAYAGSQFGAFLITNANLGSSTSPFTPLPSTATTLGVVTGRVLAVSPDGNLAVFSDTVSTPNQVYVANTSSASATTTPLNINGATTAAFSPDNSKAFILGNGGNTLNVYSALQALQTYSLTAPANAVAFSSTGAFALLAGGSSDPSTLAIYNTCDNSKAYLTLPPPPPAIPPLPGSPIFLKMVPAGSAPAGNASIPMLFQSDLNNLDVFLGIDSTGIDVIATTTTTPLPPPANANALCPVQQITYATEVASTGPTFYPLHINLQRGTFHPINFFVSPDGTQVFIVTSDQGVLIYSFNTQSVNAIPLSGGAAPVAADMTVDGTLLYVAGTDGILHELNTALALDVLEIPFAPLPNSTNNFCFENFTCSLNLVAVKP